ncbi:hypothetical protein CDD83_7472 [Cordyceps sp. RAO-2017]|nr:hypothetical protein CDD83_7472 [Cordyceps sp. RAO-2017]
MDSPVGLPDESTIRLPQRSELGTYDGAEPAMQWLSQVRWAFRALNGNAPCPNAVITAIYIGLKGKAATYISGSRAMTAIMERAQEGQATVVDQKTLEQALKTRFPAQRLYREKPVMETLTLFQREGEALEDYQDRARQALSDVDCTETVDPDADPKYANLQRAYLSNFLMAFVDGLKDPDLRCETLERVSNDDDTFAGVCRAMMRAKTALEARKKQADHTLEKLTLTALRDYTRQSGITIEQLLNQRGLDPALAKRGEKLAEQAHVTEAASISTQRVQFSGRTLPMDMYSQNTRNREEGPTQGSTTQATAMGTGGGTQGQNPGLGWNGTGQQAYAPGPFTQQQPGQATRGGRGYGHRGGFGTTWSPRNTASSPGPGAMERTPSRNPYVNGTMTLPSNQPVCFSCGNPGHISTHCDSQVKLTSWERDILRAKHNANNPTRSDNTGQRSQMVQPPAVAAHMASFEPEEAQLYNADIASRRASFAPGTDSLDEGDIARVFEVPTPSGGSDIQSGFESRMLSIMPIEPTKGREKSKKVTIEEPDEEADQADDETELMGGLAGLGIRDENHFQELLEGAMAFLALANGMEPSVVERPAAKKRNREGLSVASMLNDPTDSETYPRRHKSQTVRAETPAIRTREAGKMEAKHDKTREAQVLAPVKAREGLGSFDWKALAHKIVVPLTLADLWQVSPECARIFKQLSTRQRTLKKKKGRGKTKFPVEALSNKLLGERAVHNTSILRRTGNMAKTFRLTVTITKGRLGSAGSVSIVVPSEGCQADQGSEANLVTRQFITEHGIEALELAEIGFQGLVMMTADDARIPVTHFVILNVNCQGIQREVWAIVKPDGATGTDGTLLLGLPWLYSVGAIFDILQQTLRIGVKSLGEKRVSIQGPVLAFTRRQKLLLAPDAPGILKEYIGFSRVGENLESTSDSESLEDDASQDSPEIEDSDSGN